MELVNITELDLNGLLFVHFADGMTLDECRERLELLVYEVWDEDGEGLDDEERPPLALTPYLVYRALWRKGRAEYRNMPRVQRRKCLEWCREERGRISGQKTKDEGQKKDNFGQKKDNFGQKTTDEELRR